MKTPVKLLAAIAALLLLLPSCQDLFHPADGRTGTLLISVNAPAGATTRATDVLPDIGSFLLTIANSSGELLYEGPYDHSPDELNVPAGSYRMRSRTSSRVWPCLGLPMAMKEP